MPEISQKEIDALVEIGVLKSNFKILVRDFQRSEVKLDKKLEEILTQMHDFPGYVTKCRDGMEREIEDTLQKYYMTKKDGELIEEHLTSTIKSTLLKIWITSTIAGFVAAGGVVIFFLKVGT